jgi:hypothetical protein
MTMKNQDTSGREPGQRERRAPSLNLTTRWTSVRTQPRLVTFSWGGTTVRR